MSYTTEVLADSPLGFWKLDETTGATQFVDSSGNARPATIVGTPTYGVAGIDGTAVTFSGTQYGSIAAPAWFSSPTAFTAEAWMKITATADVELIGRDNSGSAPGASDRIFRLHHNTSGSAVGAILFLSNSSGTYVEFGSGTSLADNAWHHIVATWDGATAKLYVDGNLANSAALSGTLASGGTAPLLIATGQNNTPGNYSQFSGTLDSVALYPTALSLARISAHFTAVASTRPSASVLSETYIEALSVASSQVALTESYLDVITTTSGSQASVSETYIETVTLTSGSQSVLSESYLEVLTKVGGNRYVGWGMPI